MLKLLFTAFTLLAYGFQVAFAAFGLTHTGGFIVVDTGGGLVFKGKYIFRCRLLTQTYCLPTVNDASGDIQSLQYGGYECQDQTKFSQLSSGLGTATVSK